MTGETGGSRSQTKGRRLTKRRSPAPSTIRGDFLSALNKSEQRTLHSLLLKASHSLGFDWQ